MDDYIKRKDAEMSHCSECSWNGCCLCPCEDVKAILAIPAADVVKRPRWISVTERLPKDEKDVLAYYGFKHDGVLSDQRFIGTLCYFRFDPNPHWQHEGQGKLTVTHWMPLPEPPEGDA